MLERLKIRGYKSFKEVDISLNPVNVLIGANGSGKSNFIGLFKMFRRMMNEELQIYVAQAGGADQILHYGRKITDRIEFELWFQRKETLANGYVCHLIPAEDSLLIVHEATYFHRRTDYPRPYEDAAHHGVYPESLLPKWAQNGAGVVGYVFKSMDSWRLYHFHDTSESARVKHMGDIHDNRFLQPDAANLAAYLYLLRETHPQHYRNIVETVRLAAPYFGDFILRLNPRNPERIRLEWHERGSDLTFGPHALSDGTLRFICLATLFLQPAEALPSTIVLDEPELGLHPYAIVLLAEMVRSVSEHTQVILATQSVTLVNQFTPEDILVVDRMEGVSTIRRLEQEDVAQWLDDYALGDLWEKNVLGGRPSL